MAVKQTIIDSASSLQKEKFLSKFADIIKANAKLRDKYKVQFFDSPSKSNYAFYGLDGKSINVLQSMSIEEIDAYRALKNHWRD
ncbi:MAG: hypothetical protein ACXVB0_01255 [Mucilaginibacter sp.]